MKYIYLLFILFLLSCKKKEGNFTLSGTITDKSFNTGLNEATISLYQVKATNNSLIFISSSTLDTDGKYSFVFKREMMDKYILKISKPNYINLEETIPFSSLDIENENIRNYSTSAKSWVRLKFFNLNPSDTDQLEFRKQNGNSNCEECLDTSKVTLFGSVDTSLIYLNDGNTPFSYLYSEIGTNNTGIKSAVTIPFDTTEIYLEY